MLSEQEVNALHPLQLAYIGDSVYTLLVRVHLLGEAEKLKIIHAKATSMVCAASQAKSLTFLIPFLKEEELDVVRKGRNAHSKHAVPKSASVQEYMYSTALEALFGYLYLLNREDRIQELFQIILHQDMEDAHA